MRDCPSLSTHTYGWVLQGVAHGSLIRCRTTHPPQNFFSLSPTGSSSCGLCSLPTPHMSFPTTPGPLAPPDAGEVSMSARLDRASSFLQRASTLTSAAPGTLASAARAAGASFAGLSRDVGAPPARGESSVSFFCPGGGGLRRASCLNPLGAALTAHARVWNRQRYWDQRQDLLLNSAVSVSSLLFPSRRDTHPTTKQQGGSEL